ncbi:MAG: S8 family serine peptidase [Candidatus Hermodarchaeota archaeon]
MKKNLINLKKIFIVATLIITVLTPIFGINVYFGQNLSSAEDLQFDPNQVISSLSLQSDTDSSIQNVEADNLIFDHDLKRYLNNLKLKDVDGRNVKVIVLFDDSTHKSERINAINSILDNVEILNNYDIIPGVYLSCDPNELLLKSELLEELGTIKKIFKSKVYSYPIQPTELPHSSALNSVDYPNWWIPAIGADGLAFDGSGVRVAIVDTGIYEHPDLNVVLSQNFISGESSFYVDDIYGHGTHVAGIVGSDGTSSNGIYRGVAPGVSLINAKAGGLEGLEDGDIISAIDWSVLPVISGGAGADIISMSFGGGYPNASDPLARAMTNAARNYGVILVSSAGNSGPDYFTGGSPASGPYIISVGATDSSNNLASFSSWGPSFSYLGYPDVVAPGVDIIATEAPNSVISKEMRYLGDFFDYIGDSDYIPLSGTSMSCPMVAGALAIIKEAYPSITSETARIALLEGASKFADHNFLKYGAGLINVSKSLEYLNQVNLTYGNVNNISILFPDEVPLEPFDLLHFPGDYQSFNLTLFSGIANTYDINVPSNVDGLSVSLDKSQVTFADTGFNFITLDIKIKMNAQPGIRSFELNVTSGSTLYDSITISVEVKLPDYKILMESYHGLNDWFPEISFYQMRFYEMMNSLSELNISVDYLAELWTPYYNKGTDNSFLTESKLSKYDLIVLQNPILPFNPLEMNFLKEYFNNGGNILFLGTRYQDLCSENLNALFDNLELDLQINEENIIYETWLGIGLYLNTNNVTDLNSIPIFNGVDKFIWSYGNTFTTSGNVDSIASIGGQTVAASYDGNPFGKGRFIAFGDLHWLTDYFTETDYQQDHMNLLKNIINYFLYQEDISINLALSSELTSTPQVNISAYVQNQILNIPIASSSLNLNLTASIENTGYFEIIDMVSPFDGFSTNYSITLPFPSDSPYSITVNLTLGQEVYIKTIKVLYYDSNSYPQISFQTISGSTLRDGFDSLSILSQLNKPNYDVDAYMAIYSYSLFNSKKTVNRTLNNFNNPPFSTTYTKGYTPTSSDPAGLVLAYTVPKNISSNYYNPFSKRLISSIFNHAPIIDEFNSTFSIDGSAITRLEDTYTLDTSYVYRASQGSIIDFRVKAYDSVNYEDPNMSNMRVSINLFICLVSEDDYLVFIFPNKFPVSVLNYQSSSDIHQGTFEIPYTIQYSTIRGLVSISTVTNFDLDTNEGYIAIIMISVDDSEGGTNDFIIIFLISAGQQPFFLILGLVIAAIVIVSSLTILLLVLRKRKKSRQQKITEEYYSPYEDTTTAPTYQQPSFSFCPYCGFKIMTLKNYCPNCGKQLKFKD